MFSAFRRVLKPKRPQCAPDRIHMFFGFTLADRNQGVRPIEIACIEFFQVGQYQHVGAFSVGDFSFFDSKTDSLIDDVDNILNFVF